MSKQNQPEHKGKANTNFILADWNTISEQLIYDAVTKEGKPIIAKTLGINIDVFRDWFKFRKINIPVIRNANYYNARKPLEEQGAWEDELSKQILVLMEEARSKRLKEYKEENEHIEIICPTCGKVFETSKNNPQKYCSASCVSNRIRSNEEKAKLSKSCAGREAWNKGRKYTEEELKRMSETSKEFWSREGFKEKMSEIQKESWSNKELLDKHSQIMHDSTSRPEVINKIKAGLKTYYENLDPQVLTDRYKKQIQTKNEKGWTYVSEGENALIDYVKSLGFNPIKYVYGKANTRFEIDCYIPELKIGIEYNGIYYHSTNGSNKKAINYHFKKSEIAKSLGIDLIQIWEDQWKKQNDIIKDILRIRLNKTENKIYARKCEIRDVSTSDYRDFCNTYHIQRYRSASVKLGLYYKEELIQIASFNKARSYGNNGIAEYEWEWIRGVTKFNTIVVGGTSKLLNYFIKTYTPKNILCYCDWNLFNGKGYENSGFQLLSYTGPDLFFIRNSSTLERINRNPYSNDIHKQMVKEGKLFECHGCGSKKFVWYADV